jgi:hypothetical protein
MQGINMNNFIQATEHEGYMYAKFEYLNIYAFFVIKYFKILILVIFYNAIMHKCIFGRAYC